MFLPLSPILCNSPTPLPMAFKMKVVTDTDVHILSIFPLICNSPNL